MVVLRKVYNYYRSYLHLYCLPTKFAFGSKNNEPIYSANWLPKDDIELIRLILEYGHTKWNQICSNFFQNDKSKSIRGYEYLKNSIWPTMPSSDRWKNMIATCVKIRSNCLLGNEAFENAVAKGQIS